MEVFTCINAKNKTVFLIGRKIYWIKKIRGVSSYFSQYFGYFSFHSLFNFTKTNVKITRFTYVKNKISLLFIKNFEENCMMLNILTLKQNIFLIQEQYKTIFLTLHEMFKAQPNVLCTAEFLHKSQTDSSAFKKEFQVELLCK